MPTRRRAGRLLAVLAPSLLLVVATVVPAGAATPAARARVTTTTVPAGPLLPKSWLLLDVDTGRVLDEHDDHTLRRPASTIKLLTVLTAKRHLKSTSEIEVSDVAAGMPARKIGLTAGETWPIDDIVDSAIVVSANDAAVALAEASAGSLADFSVQMTETARDLGAVDSPTVADPAGLDDNFANGGGDWISAWDLAIIGRAALRDPQIATLASSPIVRFTDPSGHAHRLLNHNKLLTMYQGANGLKTGYTKAAGNTLVASATRDGRTMLVVVLDAPDLYGPVKALFDRGFATAPATEVGPKLVANALSVKPTAPRSSTSRTTMVVARTAGSSALGRDTGEWIALAGAGAAVGGLEVRRRRRRRAVRS